MGPESSGPLRDYLEVGEGDGIVYRSSVIVRSSRFLRLLTSLRLLLMRLMFLVSSVSFLGAPVAVGAPQRNEELILAELRQLRAQMAQVQNSQIELEALLEKLVERQMSQDEDLRKVIVDTKTTLSQLEEDMSILSARLDETNGRIGNLRQELSSLRQAQLPVTLPSSPGEEEPAESESEGETPAPAEPLTATAPSSVDLYNQAYTDYTQGRYRLAISGFTDVYKLYPDSDLADNAQYWIGECYLAQRQHQEALEAFDAVIREYPSSNKLPDAYYKKAVALIGLERRAEAMQILEIVIEQFPRTQVERLARQRLTELMRGQPPGL